MKLFDTRTALVLLAMLVVAALAAGLTLAAGGTWPAALLVGGGSAWSVLATLPFVLK
ncbi:hypothetical protein MRQ36_04815 [Micromonospora sp. R77]|uniref:hypothetical protein n=1 Tax=Micromonospora sp. R77 TaxID=2925836 RepID=UPI001F61FB80|nr:hypothetical protein [Micromonospora sp. R77]MCI4061922.1 hypothetical protein [Micromonospora sp. R77]